MGTKAKRTNLIKAAKTLGALDITEKTMEYAQKLKREKHLSKILFSKGINGMNGALLQDENGKYYLIAKANTILNYLV